MARKAPPYPLSVCLSRQGNTTQDQADSTPDHNENLNESTQQTKNNNNSQEQQQQHHQQKRHSTTQHDTAKNQRIGAAGT